MGNEGGGEVKINGGEALHVRLLRLCILCWKQKNPSGISEGFPLKQKTRVIRGKFFHFSFGPPASFVARARWSCVLIPIGYALPYDELTPSLASWINRFGQKA